jgi:hypothetical protein
MLSRQAIGVSTSTIAAFSTSFGLSFLYCTIHPSGSRSLGRIIPPVRKSRDMEISNPFWNLPYSFEPETPVPYSGTQKTVGSRPCPKEINTHG